MAPRASRWGSMAPRARGAAPRPPRRSPPRTPAAPARARRRVGRRGGRWWWAPRRARAGGGGVGLGLWEHRASHLGPGGAPPAVPDVLRARGGEGGQRAAPSLLALLPRQPVAAPRPPVGTRRVRRGGGRAAGRTPLLRAQPLGHGWLRRAAGDRRRHRRRQRVGGLEARRSVKAILHVLRRAARRAWAGRAPERCGWAVGRRRRAGAQGGAQGGTAGDVQGRTRPLEAASWPSGTRRRRRPSGSSTLRPSSADAPGPAQARGLRRRWRWRRTGRQGTATEDTVCQGWSGGECGAPRAPPSAGCAICCAPARNDDFGEILRTWIHNSESRRYRASGFPDRRLEFPPR
jgi:hypothetical protein